MFMIPPEEELKSRARLLELFGDLPTAIFDQFTPFWPGSRAIGAIFERLVVRR